MNSSKRSFFFLFFNNKRSLISVHFNKEINDRVIQPSFAVKIHTKYWEKTNFCFLRVCLQVHVVAFTDPVR